MPEGDTIYRAAKTLNLALAGKSVTHFETVLPKLARVHEDAPLTGRLINRVEARGKHLLFEFSGELFLRTHMRMNGSWHLYRPAERWRKSRRDMRVVIGTADFVAVGFNLPVAEFVDSRALERSDVARLGPDFLADDFSASDAVISIRSHMTQPIAEVLLNQRAVAGIGNVYKSEVLFLCSISPFAPVSGLTEDELIQVVTTARKLMQMNVRTGTDQGIVTYTGFRRTTRRADPGERLWVYGRGRRPCRKCGTPIQRQKTGLDARSTYWCPSCQPSR